ncbi:MAG: stage III sporulation protein AF [Clostridia bacterium]|nr:stage III sporulation protein AF [Clostridia bacterium]
MKEFLHSIIIAAITISLFNQLLPIGRGFEKYARFVGMLVLATLILSPVINMIKGFDKDFFIDIRDDIADIENGGNNEYSELLNGYLTEYSTEQFKLGIKEILLNNYGIPEEECEILIDTKIDSGQLRVDKMQILLSGRSIFKNPYEIECYFTELVSCECSVLIKSG